MGICIIIWTQDIGGSEDKSRREKWGPGPSPRTLQPSSGRKREAQGHRNVPSNPRGLLGEHEAGSQENIFQVKESPIQNDIRSAGKKWGLSDLFPSGSFKSLKNVILGLAVRTTVCLDETQEDPSRRQGLREQPTQKTVLKHSAGVWWAINGSFT